ncbi:hypothetical protein FC83_GL002960 [Agrilactobacillus composti DSM 18527 = JCM 14202]|uniref:Phage protein n=1 Tax=Agrilactobacillus composti DSM 18527 = JCM 14202 TaxID=1423734 RepID=X0QT22_9LACO|nr:hypothetical protein [Agrilactobacillus composti]KRM33391.1 hypothetical protein FC83_GL002960 [Agrilactobacillus composti DSM 18527 = JCM 14202]GAF41770.1 hypothetical protein JCM14202_3729 [Agrilactobacillus composti DSM 18527 = JCM 14202]
MHTILGFTISEWGGITTMGTVVLGAIYKVVVKPLSDRLSDLRDALDKLNTETQIERQKIKVQLNHHDIQLARQDAELQFLYDHNHIIRKEDIENEK